MVSSVAVAVAVKVVRAVLLRRTCTVKQTCRCPHQKDGALSFVHAGGVSDNAVRVLEHLVDAAAGYPRK